MAQRFLFFNSIDGDRRRYQAQDFAEYFGSVLSSGLLHTDEIPGMSVSVEAGTMNTVVNAGKAIMRGHLYENTTPHTLTHRIPEPDADRIDRIVLRLDLRQSERNILLHIKEGEPSTNPEPPPLQRDNMIYEISLAQIFVERNTSTLNPSNLTDERLDEDVCGLVNSLLTVPTDQFVAEWDSFFADKSAEIQQFADDYAQLLLDAEQAFQNDRDDFEQEWDTWFANQQTEGFVMANEKGEPNGVMPLNSEGIADQQYLPEMPYVKLGDKATEAEAEEGVVNNKYMTPLRTKNAIENLGQYKLISRHVTENVASIQLEIPDGYSWFMLKIAVAAQSGSSYDLEMSVNDKGSGYFYNYLTFTTGNSSGDQDRSSIIIPNVVSLSQRGFCLISFCPEPIGQEQAGRALFSINSQKAVALGEIGVGSVSGITRVDSIKFTPASGNFRNGSTFSLWGLK